MSEKPIKQNITNLYLFFAREYPVRTVISIAALLIAGIFEGLGVVLLLPLVVMLMDENGAANEHIQLIEQLFTHFHLPMSFGILLFAMIALIIVKSIISYMAMHEFGKTAALMTARLRSRLLRALFDAKWPYYTHLSIGRASNGLILESEQTAAVFTLSSTMISDAIMVCIYFCIALAVSPEISLASIAGGSALILLFRHLVRSAHHYGNIKAASMNGLIKSMVDSLNIVKPIKAMGRQKHYGDILANDIDTLRHAQQTLFSNKEAMRFTREPVLAIFVGCGLYVAVTYMNYELSTVMVMAFLFMRMVMKLAGMQSHYQHITQMKASFWSLRDLIITSEAAKEDDQGRKNPALKKAITITDLSFGYDSKTPILKNIDLTLSAHKLHILSGLSGSGKTTLVDLLLGFYRPEEGEILVDGTSLQDINLQKWRNSIGYVPQDCTLLNEDVMTNVTLGDKSISKKRVVQALKDSGAWDFVSALENGLAENLGEKGNRLSGGQRQRIAIARALVKNPLLLMLDEPTSALDSKTEAKLLKMLKTISKSVTVIIISHSQDILPYADQAITLEKGRVTSNNAGKATKSTKRKA